MLTDACDLCFYQQHLQEGMGRQPLLLLGRRNIRDAFPTRQREP